MSKTKTKKTPSTRRSNPRNHRKKRRAIGECNSSDDEDYIDSENCDGSTTQADALFASTAGVEGMPLLAS
eukprot:CAMPEP_0201690296 /NCGR_PEP_ID=MMETSP0578-20130828/3769_1 /ASSEMBLY_ACC=CAM_ASM_000663 /TAXON_ID=267565 /ORGANISM="Skeletonema grethea, Strain CCMP 1804" /LENGTH=69 /DNA_ID=CAMNT_0048175241 /DNA_START=26 /DNA_END=232 /DNA_ORIENTATION=+